MRYTLCVIVPVQDKALLDDFKLNYEKESQSFHDMFADKLRKPLAKFDLNREMPVHKEYLKASELRRMKAFYKTDDPQELIKNMKAWNGEDGGGVDEAGIFIVTRRNPMGRMDYWGVAGIDTTEHFQDHLEDDRIPHMLLLPDLRLIESTDFVWDQSDEAQWQAWLREMKTHLAKFPGALAVLVDCHGWPERLL